MIVLEKEIYVDHSATTAIKKEVLNEMIPYFNEKYGNASSIHKLGITSKQTLENCRERIANAIGAKFSDEIYFVSGGSEADNMIIRGIAYANKNKGKHIITTNIEHMAVLNTCKMLEKEGYEITYLKVDEKGLINVNDVKKAVREDTILISVMYANNEIGTIEPIEEIAKFARFKGIFFHTDAVQVIGNIKIDAEKMCIDAMSISAHKFYGPKGIGVAYIRKNIKFQPLILGGHQENNMRAGTENLPGIVGMTKAIELANLNIEEYNQKLLNLRKEFIEKLQNIKNIRINGDIEKRLPGNVNFLIYDVQCSALLLILDMNGIYASSGSACNSSSTSPSHVLKAIGLSDELASNSIRITFGEENTKEDVEYIISKISYGVNKFRMQKNNR